MAIVVGVALGVGGGLDFVGSPVIMLHLRRVW